MRTWWRGEALKSADLDNASALAIVQSGEDSRDELRVFATTALNKVLLLSRQHFGAELSVFDDNRVPFYWVDLTATAAPGDEQTVEGEMAKYTFFAERLEAEQPLRRAIFDYVVQHVLWLWCNAVRPDLSQDYLTILPTYEAALEKALDQAGGGRFRRRGYRLMGL